MSTDHIPEKELSIQLIVKNIASFLKFIRHNLLAILLFGIAGLACGITYAWLTPATYQASLTFSAEEQKGSSSGLASIASQFGLNIGTPGTVFSGDNLLALITSKRIIKRSLLKPLIIDNVKTNLLNRYLDIYLSKSFKKDTTLKTVSFPIQQDVSTYSRLQDSVLNLICESLIKKNIFSARNDKRLEIFEIACTSIDETFSIELSKQLITEVSSFYIETKTKRSAETVNILQNKVDSIKREYNEALSGRAEMADANINPAMQQPVVGIQRRQTDITVLAAAYSEIVKNLEVAKFNLLQNTPLIQVIDEPSAPLKKIKGGRLLTGLIWGFLFSATGIFLISAWKAYKKDKK